MASSDKGRDCVWPRRPTLTGTHVEVMALLGDEVPEGDPGRADDGDGANAVLTGDVVALALAPRVDAELTVGTLLTPLDDALWEEPTIGDDDSEIELDCVAPSEAESGDTLEGMLEDVSVAACVSAAVEAVVEGDDDAVAEGDACEFTALWLGEGMAPEEAVAEGVAP